MYAYVYALALSLFDQHQTSMLTGRTVPGSGGGGDDRHDRITRIRVGSRGMSCIKLV